MTQNWWKHLFPFDLLLNILEFTSKSVLKLLDFTKFLNFHFRVRRSRRKGWREECLRCLWLICKPTLMPKGMSMFLSIHLLYQYSRYLLSIWHHVYSHEVPCDTSVYVSITLVKLGAVSQWNGCPSSGIISQAPLCSEGTLNHPPFFCFAAVG